MKIYYVSGKDFFDNDVMEKVYADTPGEAIRKSLKVSRNARALSPKTAADRAGKARKASR